MRRRERASALGQEGAGDDGMGKEVGLVVLGRGGAQEEPGAAAPHQDRLVSCEEEEEEESTAMECDGR